MKWAFLLEGENISKDTEQWNPFSLFTAERISPTSKKIEKSDAGWWKKFAWCLPFEKVVLRTSSASVINQSSTQHLFFPPIGSAIYVGVLSAPEAKEANGSQLVYIFHSTLSLSCFVKRAALFVYFSTSSSPRVLLREAGNFLFEILDPVAAAAAAIRRNAPWPMLILHRRAHKKRNNRHEKKGRFHCW